jgi:hypothetical protein
MQKTPTKKFMTSRAFSKGRKPEGTKAEKARHPFPRRRERQSLTEPALALGVIPHFEKVEMEPPNMCLRCSNHTYNNNMINRCHVR